MFVLHLLSPVLLLTCLAFHSTHGFLCTLEDDGTKLVCMNITDHPDSLDHNLRHQFSFSTRGGESKKVVEIRVGQPREGGITINNDTFGTFFPNLSKLILHGGFSNITECTLNIHSEAFRHTPALMELRIVNFNLPDGSVLAIASLKDQLGALQLNGVGPADKIFPRVSDFSNLWYLSIDGCLGVNFVPSAFLAKTAPTLKQLVINSDCPPPDLKITASMFSNMPNLTLLHWLHSNITEIEAGAFDANPKLEFLAFYGNRIQSLPDGLLSRLPELLDVDFRDNDGLTGLSRSNFTHVKYFGQIFNLSL